MSYSQFSIEEIKTTFGLTISEKFGIFADIPEIEYSDFLAQALQKYIPLALAIDTKKSRSEFIIAPILFELKTQLEGQIGLFSGKDFNVDLERGLNGRCDFLISRSPEQLLIEAPVITLVEAAFPGGARERDNIKSGLGQCMAEMLAAQLFNQRQENEIQTIYGSVTTGTNWKFLKLEEQTISIDLNEYFLNNVGKILGILRSAIE